MVSGTKLDDSSPTGQVVINGFETPFCLDRNGYGGETLLFSRKDMPSKLLPVKNENQIEVSFVAINLKDNKNWFINCFDNPYRGNVPIIP